MAEAGPFRVGVWRGVLGVVKQIPFEDDRKKGNSNSNGKGNGKSFWVWRLCFPTHDDEAVMNGPPRVKVSRRESGRLWGQGCWGICGGWEWGVWMKRVMRSRVMGQMRMLVMSQPDRVCKGPGAAL